MKREKIIFMFLLSLIIIALSITISYADEQIFDESPLEDNLCEDVEQLEPFGFDNGETLMYPQYSFDDAEKDNIGPTRDKGNTSESSDMNLSLGMIPNNMLDSEGNGNNFYNIIPRATIKQRIETDFPLTSPNEHVMGMQGATSDGTYMFISFVDFKNDSSIESNFNGIIIVTCHFNSSNAIVIDGYYSSKNYSQLANLKHCNSMTYNSTTDQIVVSCGGSSKTKIYTMNAGFFRGTTTSLTCSLNNVSCKSVGIAYNETLNRYVITESSNHNLFCILDGKFNLIGKAYKTADANTTVGHQGVYCDDTYIYALYYISGLGDDISYTKQNVIGVFDWSGNLKKEINLGITRQMRNGSADTIEGESIFAVNDKLLVGMSVSYAKSGESARNRKFYVYDLSPFLMHVGFASSEAQISNASTEQFIVHTLSTPIIKNKFTNEGYKLNGWYAYNSDTQKWLYSNSSGTRNWYTKGAQPSGYSLHVYADKESIAQTVPAGNHVIFVANWGSTNYFYISFNSNGGSGSMSSQQIVYNTNTAINANAYTKYNSKSGVNCTFKGWTAFNVETSKWLYQSADGSTTGWYKECKAPTGYVKKSYNNQATIARTTKAGQHLIFYAKWNEFKVYYNANGKEIKAANILTPKDFVYGTATTLDQFTKSDGYTNKNYRAHRLEKDTWLYKDSTTNSNVWLPYGSEDSTHSYVTYSATTTISKTVPIGETVIMVANAWNP